MTSDWLLLRTLLAGVTLACVLGWGAASAQEESNAVDAASSASEDQPSASEEPAVAEGTEKIIEGAKQTVEGLARDVDQSETAKEAAAGILKPIYLIAERLSFPAFHWLAFAIMVSGVVNFALQLVLAKLVVLSKFSLSFREILLDTQGLVISVVGLVLTTQAAAENSTFTQSPFAVLTATAAGGVLGFVFYRWGQATELEAVAGRQAVKPPKR